jgi:hypothetical protein
VGDALMPSISEPGTRLYNRAGVDSADVKLLIHGNVGSGQSFSDSSLSNHTVTANGDVTHSTTDTKFTGGSIYFDGVDDYLTIPASGDWDVGTGDWTFDCWVRPTTSSSAAYVFETRSASYTGNFSLYRNGLALVYYAQSTTIIYTSDVLTVNSWSHVALVRSGSTVTIYVDGVSAGSGTDANDYQGLAPFTIGTRYTGTGDWTGYMDEIRFTKGVALWTQAFTPPARRDTLSISDGMMYNGTCFDFDGTDDVVEASNSVITGTGDFTFTAWINRATVNTYDYICGNYGTGNTGGVEFYGINTGEIRCYIAGSVTGSVTLVADTWYHVACTRTGGSVQLYVNGVADGSPVTRASSITGSINFGIGNDSGGGTSENFDGKIADVKVFDIALSAANLKELYDDSKVIIPSNVPQTNLKGWWPLAEGAGDICYDGSGNGYHGTATNTDGDEWLTGQTGCPQLVEGYNRPMLFDGSNDYLEVPDDSSFDTTTKVSIAAWVYADPSLAAGSRGGQIVYTRDGEKGYGLRMRNDGSGNLEIRFSNGSGSFGHLSGSTALSAGVWYHLCGTYDTAVGKKVYVNGVQDGSDTDTGDLDKGTGVIQLGTRGGGSMFGGIFNEVIIYNSTLSLAQIQALAATGPNGGPLPPNAMALSNSSDIAGYWRNDSNLSWTDLSGNGNDTGSASGSPDALLFKQGINGQKNVNTGRDGQGFPLKYKDVGAIGFVSDLVDFGNVISFDNTDNFTVEAWFRADVASGMDSYQPIVSKEGSSEFGYGLKIDRAVAGGPWFYGIATGTTNRYQYAAALTNGEWYHGCVLFSSSTNYITVFINGEQSHGPYSSQGAFSGTTSTNSLKFGQTGSNFIGQIGSSKIYNRLLSQAEIKQNYNAQRSRFT